MGVKAVDQRKGNGVISVKQIARCSCHHDKIWIISNGCDPAADLSVLTDDTVEGHIKEYQLSDIGRYLLNPAPIEVKKKLIGGEIYHKQGLLKKTIRPFRDFLKEGMHGGKKDPALSSEVIVSRFKLRIPSMKDSGLEKHLTHICGLLRSYDSVAKRLTKMDSDNISQVLGICEDIGGSYSYLKLQGSIEERIKYLKDNISKDVGVVLNKAYIQNGLFELRGYDFQSYDADKSYRLISYRAKGTQRICLLADENTVDFYLSDPQLIRYMHLLEQALRANPSFREALEQCIRGQAKPFKLFFNKKLGIDYSKTHFPEIYRDVFRALKVGLTQRNFIKPMLNQLQIGVSVNYVPLTESAEERMFTHVSVLHDFRALDPLRKNLPRVYGEMQKRTVASEAGKFYLLDSINGFSNAW
jgi:hypothetical protein